MLFKAVDLRVKNQARIVGFFDAFDTNSARRKFKKTSKMNRIPKRILVVPMSDEEVRALFTQKDAPVEASPEIENPTPLVDPLNGFEVINASEKDLARMEASAEVLDNEKVEIENS